MKQQFLPTEVPNSSLPVIEPTDDIDVAIVKLMSNFKGYSLDEVYDKLKDQVDDPDAIKPTMFALNTQGWFDSKDYRAAGVVIYTLRRGRTAEMLAADHKRSTKVRKFRQPEVATIKPEAQILVSEGIDIGVWKAMQDRNWRSVKDIVAMLVTFGFDRIEVDRRLMALIRTNRWFDRTGTGRNTTYRLKAKMTCPVAPSRLMTSMLDSATLPEESPIAEDTHDTDDKVHQEYFPVTIVDQATRKQAMQAVQILPTDTIHEAMWKVMADGEEYTVNDLVLLLEEYGFNEKRISPNMSRHFASGFFTRRNISDNENRPKYAYRLNVEEVPANLRSLQPEPEEAQPQLTEEP